MIYKYNVCYSNISIPEDALSKVRNKVAEIRSDAPQDFAETMRNTIFVAEKTAPPHQNINTFIICHKAKSFYGIAAIRTDSNGKPIDMPFKCKLEMLADYLAAGRTYMKDSFSYESELKWYLNKITVEDPNIHPRTSDFILKALALLCDGAKNDRMKESYKLIRHWYD